MEEESQQQNISLQCPYSSTRGYGKVRDFFPPACLPVPATRTGRFAIHERPGSRKAATQQLDVQDGDEFWLNRRGTPNFERILAH